VSSQVRPGRSAAALGHPLRVALLGLLSRRATLTATQAAGELGESSGACSFHLRQLERFGLVEEAPGQRGRVRPWRLAAPRRPGAPAIAEGDDEFGKLARELENEGFRRWQAGRETAPPGWHDEAFSAVVYLTPDELTEVAAALRSVISAFTERADPGGPGRPGRGAGRPTAELMPVGVVARMFPLLPASSDG
jgi:DNA-binding transcriptional ArsR family regulator